MLGNQKQNKSVPRPPLFHTPDLLTPSPTTKIHRMDQTPQHSYDHPTEHTNPSSGSHNPPPFFFFLPPLPPPPPPHLPPPRPPRAARLWVFFPLDGAFFCFGPFCFGGWGAGFTWGRSGSWGAFGGLPPPPPPSGLRLFLNTRTQPKTKNNFFFFFFFFSFFFFWFLFFMKC